MGDSLSERATLLKTLVDHVPAMLAYWDRELRCRFANRAYTTWFGVDPDALVGRSIADLLGPTLFAMNEPYMRAALAGQPQRFERLVPGPGGVSRHSVATYTPDVVDGEVRGFIAHVADVTPLKLAEAALGHAVDDLTREVARRHEAALEAEALLSASLAGIDAGLVATDEQGRVTRLNDVAERLTGWSAAEARGRSVWQVLAREGRPAELTAQNPIDVVNASPAAFAAPRRLTLVTRDGAAVPVEILATTVHDAGQIRGLAIVFRDTRRLDAAEQAGRRLAAVVTGSADAIIALALDGTITDWNQGAERLFGYPADRAIGHRVGMLHPPDDSDDGTAALAEVARGDAVGPFDGVRVHADGRPLAVSVSLSPIRDEAGHVVGASKIVRDISEALALTAELKRSNAALERFAYVASHDLQEPLRMVVSYGERLAERYRGQLDERANRYLSSLVDGGARMQRLVSDLLTYARVGSQGKPLVPVVTEHEVATVLDGLAAQIAAAGAEVVVGPLPPVRADDTQLRQLVQNLVSNAIKFRGATTPRITISARAAGDFVELAVADNGIGLDMKFAEQIFQMFQRLNPRDQYPGTGIGLAVVKGIVDRHGGRIWVESAPGAGTTFHVTLPAVPPDPATAAASP